ncbi:MAG: hypothetical protein E6Q97_31160 [Desulfurellales bacterium]|nr:MAG: hypothetical protein E6Q97_31160 [Desulfurellales bacterium]
MPPQEQGTVIPFPGTEMPAPVAAGAPERSFPSPSSIELGGKEHGKAHKVLPEADLDPDGVGISGERLFRMYESFESLKLGERREHMASWMYYHGRQWSAEQIAVLRQRKQLPTYYNRIRRKVNFLVGTEQRLRRDPKAEAKHPAYDNEASAGTHCLRFVQDRTDAPSQISLASLDYFVAGIGVLYQGVATVAGKTDPTKLHVPESRFFYDPRSEKHDFSDSKYLGLWQWVEVDTAIEMMLALGNKRAAARLEGLSNFHAQGYAGTPAEWQKAKMWVDSATSSIKLVEMYYRHRGKWRLAFLVGSVKLHDMESVFVDEHGNSRHAFNAQSCNIDEEGDRYGIIRDMIAVQDQINHRLSKLLHLMSTRQLVYEEGSLLDAAKAHREFLKPDGRIPVKPGALSGKNPAFKVLEAAAEIKGQAELLQSAIQEIENIGPNPGLIGRGEGINTQSGRAILAQQNAGMIELSPEFDRLRSWKLRSYRLDWATCRQYWVEERFIRVADGRKSRLVGINRVVVDPATNTVRIENNIPELDVDIAIDEGPDTTTVREELLQTFSQLGAAAMSPLGKILIELSGVPDKDRLIQMIDELSAPPPEMAALQQRLGALEAALKEAQVDKTQADVAVAHSTVDRNRAEALKSLFGIALPPDSLDQSFPRPYGDTPGVEAPKPPPEALGINPAWVIKEPPAGGRGAGAPRGQQGAPSPGAADPGPNGFLPDAPPQGGVGEPPLALPGDDPRLGQPGTLPMPEPGTLPAQGPPNAFAF